MSTNQEPSRNYVGAKNAGFREVFEHRTLENAVPYIVPVLASLPPDFKLLDVGCGPGSITLDIAQRYPRATVVGVDGGSDAVAHARALAEKRGVKNARFMLADALDLRASAPELADHLGTFDMVHTHQVLVHLTDAKRGFRQLYEAARPGGGVVCCCETDMALRCMYPEPSGEAEYCFGVMTPMIMQKRGADPYVGRKLVSHALAAGFKRENITAGISTKVYSSPEERAHWAGAFGKGAEDPATVKMIQDLGMELNLRAALSYWETFCEAEDGWAGLSSPTVICRK